MKSCHYYFALHNALTAAIDFIELWCYCHRNGSYLKVLRNPNSAGETVGYIWLRGGMRLRGGKNLSCARTKKVFKVSCSSISFPPSTK
jgi:hypothetical protein